MATPQRRKSGLLRYERHFNSNLRRYGNSAYRLRKKKTNKPITIKTILGWALMGGKSEKYHICLFICLFIYLFI